jgi:hypothetical protein
LGELQNENRKDEKNGIISETEKSVCVLVKENSDVWRINERIAHGESVNTKDENGNSCIFWAIINGNVTVLRLLLLQGAEGDEFNLRQSILNHQQNNNTSKNNNDKCFLVLQIWSQLAKQWQSSGKQGLEKLSRVANTETKTEVKQIVDILNGLNGEANSQSRSSNQNILDLLTVDSIEVCITCCPLQNKIAFRIRATLQKWGYSVWIDNSPSKPESVVDAAIQNCKAHILCLSEQFNRSIVYYERYELAERYRKPIIPILAEKSNSWPPNGFFAGLTKKGALIDGVDYFDLSDEERFDQVIETQLHKQMKAISNLSKIFV